jgi:plastocyanin
MEEKMRIRWASAAALALFLGVVGFGQEPAKGRFVAVIGDDGVQRVEITGGSYYFDPNDIVVKVNVPVELRVKKAGGSTPHSIALKAPEAGIDFSVSLGKEPKSIKFTPTKVGTYPFWCTKKLPFLKSHKDHGMTGVLEVVE